MVGHTAPVAGYPRGALEEPLIVVPLPGGRHAVDLPAPETEVPRPSCPGDVAARDRTRISGITGEHWKPVLPDRGVGAEWRAPQDETGHSYIIVFAL